MIATFVCEYDRNTLNEDGSMNLSFRLVGENRYADRQAVAKIKTAILGAKKRLRIDVDLYREKRSQRANNYFWQLCESLAIALHTTKLEIYRKYIKELGVYRAVTINNDAVNTFITAWGMHGIGWIAEKVDASSKNGFSDVFAYYGSSVYNKDQMRRLIDGVVEDCKQMGIETKTPDQIAEMISFVDSYR